MNKYTIGLLVMVAALSALLSSGGPVEGVEAASSLAQSVRY